MNDTAKIALLWLIRERGPISLIEIENLLMEQPNILPRTVVHELQRNLGFYSKHAVDDLFNSGLIKTENDVAFEKSTYLIVDPKLPLIQSLFEVSLTQLVNRPGKFTKAYPIFGEPLDKTKNQNWARIFVAMPFLEDLRPIYSDHILKAANELNISCKRGDDFFSTHSIIQDIWSAIYHADLCIVDCTDRNPNVFYELGIAHTLGRPTILIAKTIDDIPFDIRHLRFIIYQYTPPGMKLFEKTLKQTIQAEIKL